MISSSRNCRFALRMSPYGVCFANPLMLAVANDHALAKKLEALDTDIDDLDVLSLSTAYTLHNQIASLCDELGAHLRSDYEGTSLDAIRHMVSLDMGIAFLPALYVKSEVGKAANDVTVLPFRNNQLTRSIGMVWRKQSPPWDHLGAAHRNCERGVKSAFLLKSLRLNSWGFCWGLHEPRNHILYWKLRFEAARQ